MRGKKKQVTQTTKLEMQFTSMKHAASVSGIPIALLAEAKAGGSDGFDKRGRVDLTEVVAWLVVNGKMPRESAIWKALVRIS